MFNGQPGIGQDMRELMEDAVTRRTIDDTLPTVPIESLIRVPCAVRCCDRERDYKMPWQPVAKVPAAFERRCIPPDGVVRRLRMLNMRPPHTLSAGRLTALGATRGSTTGCRDDLGQWFVEL